MDTMTTLSEITNKLKAEGYTEDFNLQGSCLQCQSSLIQVFPHEFEVDKHYRFEGLSDPGDEAVVYAISSAKYNLKVIDFKEPHTIIEKNTTTSSYIFSLQGSFNGSIALLNKLENNPALGTIKHINFNKKRNYKSNIDELSVEVVLEKK